MSRPLIILLAGILTAGPVWSARAQTPPEQVEAYIKVVKAGQEERLGNVAAAMALYQEAVELYTETTRQHPDWQPEIMRYRIAQSRNQLERLAALIPPPPEDLIDAPAPDVVTDDDATVQEPAVAGPSPEDAAAAEARDALLREEIAILESTIEEMETERALLMEQVRTFEKTASQQNEDQQRALGELHAALATATENVATHEATIRKHEEQLAAATATNATLAVELDALKAGLAELNAALSGTAERLQTSEAQAEVLERDLRSAREALANPPALPPAGPSPEEVESLQALLRERDAEIERINGELTRRGNEFDDAVRMNKDYEGQRRQIEDERNRLVVEIQDLKKQAEAQSVASAREKELRDELRALKAENRDLNREIAGLNKALERRSSQPDDTGKLRETNLAMAEELRVYRAQLTASERRIRELEQLLSATRQGSADSR